MTLIFSALLGAAVGSFLNLCIDRLPRRQSLVRPPSHCDSCGVGLGWKDLLPILSFLALRGRCRSCGTTIGGRTPIVELLTASIFGALGYHFGISLEAAIFAFYAAVFILILFLDLEHGIIPDRIVYPAAVAAILFSFVLPEMEPVRAILGGLLGAGVMLAIYLVACWLLIPALGNHGLWLALMVFMVARAVTLGAFYPRIERALAGA